MPDFPQVNEPPYKLPEVMLFPVNEPNVLNVENVVIAKFEKLLIN